MADQAATPVIVAARQGILDNYNNPQDIDDTSSGGDDASTNVLSQPDRREPVSV